MKRIIIFFVSIFIGFQCMMFSIPEKKNKLRYEKYKPDKAIKEIMDKNKKIQKEKRGETERIEEKNRVEKKKKKKERRVLKTDLSGVYPPGSVQSFKSHFHFPPIPQYMTSTCWSFSATSFYESEIFRLTGKKIKLSEMWTPYFEYIEKAMRYIRERSYSYVAGGAESNSIQRIWKKYGIAPGEAYSGVLKKSDRHDHSPLVKELRSYLNYLKNNKIDIWNEAENREHVALIIDKYMGRPPKTFTFNGKKMCPKEFFKNETGLDLENYYSVMSTSYFPFYTKQEFRVPDNWWHSREYINLPLDVWYRLIKKSIRSGYTLVIGGDISEPGKLGSKDIAFIPSFDIPQKYIDQDSREYRIYNETSTDDHGVHLVGYTRIKGKDWFLVKDSNRSSRAGKFKGYFFFREDFIKLKMLTFTVHKDMLKDILPRIKK